MISTARAGQEQERNRAAVVRFDNKENNGDGPRRYDRSRLIMDHTTRVKEGITRRENIIGLRPRVDKKAERIRKKLKAEEIRKMLMEQCTFISLDNITQEKDKTKFQGSIRLHQDKILSYTEILRNYSKP